MENKFEMKIKALRAGKGGDYLSNEFQYFLKESGIRSEFTAAYSPQQNKASEHLNCTLVEAARSMLSHVMFTGLKQLQLQHLFATTWSQQP